MIIGSGLVGRGRRRGPAEDQALEGELAVGEAGELCVDQDGVLVPEVPPQDPLGQLVLHVLLDHPLHGPRPVVRVVPELGQQLNRRVCHHNANLPVDDPLLHPLQLPQAATSDAPENARPTEEMKRERGGWFLPGA